MRSILLLGISVCVLIAGCQPQATTSQSDQQATAGQSTTKDQAPEKTGLAIGDPAPVWEKLLGTDDQEHSLSDLADARAVVVVFTGNHCPVAIAYEDRLIELAKDYADKDVELVAINVNNGEGDSLAAMKERASDKGFNFAYIDDPSQQVPREYGATVTPHAFVLDEERTVVYRGAIDDNMKADSVTQHYVRDAIDAVLADKPVAITETKAVGCGIRYE